VPNLDTPLTIQLPGATDIIRFPGLNNTQLRRERAQRMREENSPMPDYLNWIPPLVTKLDDAQDLLYTALVLSKPLWRRAPARLLPGLGWILTANDAINFATAAIAIPLGGRNAKRTVADIWSKTGGSYFSKLGQARHFLNHTAWSPFLLQGGQALESLTGYGLSLGAVMGASTDLVYGTIAAAAGEEVEFHGPPPSDPWGKAAQFLSETVDFLFPEDVLSQEDHTLLTLAQATAMQLLNERHNPYTLYQRADEIADAQLPVRYTWNRATQDALSLEGIHWQQDLSPYLPTDANRPQFSLAASMSARQAGNWEATMSDLYAFEPAGTWTQIAATDAANTFYSWAEDETDNMQPGYPPLIVTLLQILETNVFPRATPTQDEVTLFLAIAEDTIQTWMPLSQIEAWVKLYYAENFGGWRKYTT